MKYLLLCIANILVLSISSQSLSSQNVGSTGGTFQNNGYSLAWSVGEIATETVGNTAYKLTQGFNQPKAKLTAKTIAIENSKVSIAPNPFTQVLTITSNEFVIQSIKIFDACGKEIKTLKPAASNQYFLGDIACGSYIFQIEFLDRSIQRFQIIKN